MVKISICKSSNRRMSGTGSGEWVRCPFDPLHRVTRLRIRHHIVKCRPKHPNFVPCPYNATHYYLPADMVKHLKECPSRVPRPLDNTHIYVCGEKDVSKVNLPTDPDEEDWD